MTALVPRYNARLILSFVTPLSAAEPLLLQAAAIADRPSWTGLQATARATLAFGLGHAGHSDDALAIARDALGGILTDHGVFQTQALTMVALVEAEHGDLRTALAIVEDLASRTPAVGGEAVDRHVSHAYLAWVRFLAGDLDGAAHAATAVDVPLPPRSFVAALETVTRSAVERHRGRPQRALQHHLASRLGAPPCHLTDRWMRLVEEAAAIAEALDAHHDAALLLHAADTARTTREMPVSPRRRNSIDQLRERLPATDNDGRGRPIDTIIQSLAQLARSTQTR